MYFYIKPSYKNILYQLKAFVIEKFLSFAIIDNTTLFIQEKQDIKKQIKEYMVKIAINTGKIWGGQNRQEKESRNCAARQACVSCNGFL